MKKILIGLLIVFTLLIASIYIFIPSQLTVSKAALIHCNSDAAHRFIMQTSNLQKLTRTMESVPGKNLPDGNSFIYKDVTYFISKKLQNSLEIIIHRNNEVIKSSLIILPLSADSVAAEWKLYIPSGRNPVTKIRQYQKAVSIKKDLTQILDQLNVYIENPANMYGVKITKGRVKDTFLVATKVVLPAYPNTSEIYNTIDRLKQEIQKQGAVETSEPIMNVSEDGNGQFQLMVALPTNKQLNNTGPIFFRKMVPGNFLITEVQGGNLSVLNALHGMQQYIADYKKISMAISFSALITDRSKEPDSSKWVTRIYYPIAY